MKNIRRVLAVLLAVCLSAAIVTFVACKPTTGGGDTNKYTVTFMAEDTVHATVKVDKNRRIPSKDIPADPTLAEGKVFLGWYKDAADFSDEQKWNFTTGIVTADTTLYAGYYQVFAYPAELAKVAEPVTSKLSWKQAAMGANYVVTVTDVKTGASETVPGTTAFDAATSTVTFTPSAAVQGGVKNVTVTDPAYPDNAATMQAVLFGGAGTAQNPYLVGDALDFTAISRANVAEGTYFKLNNNLTIETDRAAQEAYVFNGVLDGAGRTVTLEASNGAMIYKIGAQGEVKTLNVAGTVSSGTNDSIGTVADYNAGKIAKVNVTAKVESTAGTVGKNGLTLALDEASAAGTRGIGGGVAGTNEATGIVTDCKISASDSSHGVVKVKIGGGNIVGYNKGTVSYCVNDGCFGAYNSVESGKSLSNYSYSGGIVGINAGTVTQCVTTDGGKLLAQRYDEPSQVVENTNNAVLGGIVGLNQAGATVSECSFDGIRVHGDEAVGGIVGENAGLVTDCIAEGVYKSSPKTVAYVGGRKEVGGIAGRLSGEGSVVNCVSSVNVFAYTEGSAYAVAPKASNSVYLSANPNTKSSGTGAKNNTPVALTAPAGDNNSVVTVEGGSFDGTENNVVVGESYLTVVNGNNKFALTDGTVRLNFAFPPESTIDVVLHVGNATENDQVPETPTVLSAPGKIGYKFVGWAIVEDGEVIFAAAQGISMYDVADYDADNNGSVDLYAIFEKRPPATSLTVAVFDRYVGAENGDQIYNDYVAFLGENKTYDITFVHYGNDKTTVAEFGAMVNEAGNIDVIVGSGANINTTGGVPVISKAAMAEQFTTTTAGRQAALLSDSDFALAFFAYITGKTNASATVTVVGTTTETTQVNNLLKNEATLPEVEIPAGKIHVGWATTENATQAQISGEIDYAAVESLLAEGAVTLYPVFAAYDLTVAFWTTNASGSTTYISEEEIEAIKTGFVAYLKENGTNTDNLRIQWIAIGGVGNDDFNAAVLANGNVDVVFSGNKLDSGDNALAADTTYGKTDVKEGLFANTSRKVVVLADSANKELAAQLHTFATVTATDNNPPAETVDLVVVIHSSASKTEYITAAEIEALKTDFAAYLATKGVTNANIQWNVVTKQNGAGFNAEVAKYPNADVVIGGGTIASAEGAPALKNDTSLGSVTYNFANTSRKVGLLASGTAANATLAQYLYDFLTAVAA